jgi:hypothetical protein
MVVTDFEFLLDRIPPSIIKQCVMRIITMTETLAKLLISEVKSKRILWDMKHKSYHNRLLVDREWSKIAENVAETNK